LLQMKQMPANESATASMVCVNVAISIFPMGVHTCVPHDQGFGVLRHRGPKVQQIEISWSPSHDLRVKGRPRQVIFLHRNASKLRNLSVNLFTKDFFRRNKPE